MNFNVYLKKEIGVKITQVAKCHQRTRNSIVNEALEEWLGKHAKTEWPENFFDFLPIKDVPNFKSLRQDLKNNISEDPLA
ncbi:MAG: hypothetical protein WCF65_07705 [Parachlamydiaceae bacterium]